MKHKFFGFQSWRRRVLGGACWALILAGGAAFADSPPENIFDVYRLAERTDTTLAIARAEHRAVEEGDVQARANLRQPTLQLSARATTNEQDTTSEFGVSGSSRFANRQYLVNLSQPVFHYDRYVESLQADYRLRQSRATLQAVWQELVIRVADRYFELLTSTDHLRFARAEVLALTQQLVQAQQRFDAGFLAATDLQEIRAGADLARAQEIDAAQRIDRAREALRALTGSYPGRLRRFDTKVPRRVPAPENVAWWNEQALAQNPRLIAAQAATEEAREEVRRQQAGHLPMLDIVASWNDTTEGGRLASKGRGTSVGFELVVPIYNGGQTLSRARQAAHRYQQARDRLEQQRRDSIQQVHEAYGGIVAAISRVAAADQATASSELALKMTRLAFNAKTRTALDMVNAERTLYRAKRDQSRALFDYLVSLLKLKQAAGLLSEDDLVEISGWSGEPD